MLKVKIFTIGKNKEQWINDGIKEYEKRLSKVMQFDWVFLKNNIQLEDSILKEKFYICLDVTGVEHNSLEFSKVVFKFFESHCSRLTFVIGDANGLTKTIKEHSTCNLSLSKLTFTHQMSRLILIEQLYRAEQIYRNTKYQR